MADGNVNNVMYNVNNVMYNVNNVMYNVNNVMNLIMSYMPTHPSTSHYEDYLQNELTPGTVALLHAWLTEACRVNRYDPCGKPPSAEFLMTGLAYKVIYSIDEKDLHGTPRDSAPLPTPEELAAVMANMLAQVPNLEPDLPISS